MKLSHCYQQYNVSHIICIVKLISGHSHTNRTLVSTFEAAGSFVQDFTYPADRDQIRALIDLSMICRQFIKWECFSAAIKVGIWRVQNMMYRVMNLKT